MAQLVQAAVGVAACVSLVQSFFKDRRMREVQVGAHSPVLPVPCEGRQTAALLHLLFRWSLTSRTSQRCVSAQCMAYTPHMHMHADTCIMAWTMYRTNRTGMAATRGQLAGASGFVCTMSADTGRRPRAHTLTPYHRGVSPATTTPSLPSCASPTSSRPI